MASAFQASGVIDLFESTIEKSAAETVLMPIVTSKAGIAASAILTAVTDVAGYAGFLGLATLVLVTL